MGTAVFYYNIGNFVPYIIKILREDAHSREDVICRKRPRLAELIKVLIGIRRCGKSVLLRQIMEEIRSQGAEERYDIRGKQLLTTLDKYYLTDLGPGRIHSSGFKMEKGVLSGSILEKGLSI